MKKYILLFILLFMTSCNQNVKQVVFLGDSITQNAVINSENFKGYITLIQEEVDENIKLKIESKVFNRLISHLQNRTDVQNIDLMNLSGFCRNCLSKWYSEEADHYGRACRWRGGRLLHPHPAVIPQVMENGTQPRKPQSSKNFSLFTSICLG